MTSKQIKILKASENGIHFYDDLDTDGQAVMLYLAQNGFCSCEVLSPPIYTITEKGKAELKELEDYANEVRDKKTDERTAKSGDRRFQLLNSILSAVVSAIAELARTLFKW